MITVDEVPVLDPRTAASEGQGQGPPSPALDVVYLGLCIVLMEVSCKLRALQRVPCLIVSLDVNAKCAVAV